MTETVLDRFLRYVQIETTSNPDSKTTPSSECQWALLRLLAGELEAMGASDLQLLKHGYVLATIPATAKKKKLPTVAFYAHVDTAPDFYGKGVKPIVHR
ncbi:MAG TPA: hypothetical protein VI547_06530, partial [Anaerolineales bacterium]|nr:hypothetical protein [Anaerolineales bacterium]